MRKEKSTFLFFVVLSFTTLVFFPLNAFAKSNVTELIVAVERGDLKKVKSLIKAGADVNKPGGNLMWGKSPLMMSMLQKRYDIFSFLIEHEADVNAKDEDGNFPLIVISKYNLDIKFLKKLVDHGADINARNKNGEQFVHSVSRSYREQDKELLEYAISKGANINSQGKWGTPLHHAVQSGNVEGVKILVDLGADVYIKNLGGQTAKEMAHQKIKETAHLKYKSTIRDNKSRQEIIDYLEVVENKRGSIANRLNEEHDYKEHQDFAQKYDKVTYPYVREWAINAVLDTMSFGYDNYEAKREGSQKYFSETGWKSFGSALDKSQIIKIISKNKQTITAILSPDFKNEDILQSQGGYQWVLKFPITMIYSSDKSSFKQDLLITIVVGKNDKRSDKVAIEQWIAQAI